MAGATVTQPGVAVAPAGSRRHGPFLGAVLRTARNPMGFVGLIILGILAFVAIGAPFLAPYDPLLQHPGF